MEAVSIQMLVKSNSDTASYTGVHVKVVPVLSQSSGSKGNLRKQGTKKLVAPCISPWGNACSDELHALLV